MRRQVPVPADALRHFIRGYTSRRRRGRGAPALGAGLYGCDTVPAFPVRFTS